jgi:hypothetical protein
MADFTQSYVDGPARSAITPLAPVSDNSGALRMEGLASAISSIGQGASDFLSVKTEQNKAQAIAELEAGQNQATSGFLQAQLKIADAVDTGQMDSARGRILMRRNLTDAIANNPGMAVDLGKAHTSVLKTTGLAQAVYEGTENEQAQQSIDRKTIESGWASPNDSPEQKAQATAARLQFERGAEMASQQAKLYALEAAKIGLTNAGLTTQTKRVALLNAQNKANSQMAVGQITQAYGVRLNGEFERIRAGVEDGTIPREQGLMMLDQTYLAVDQVVRQAGAQAGGDYVSNQAAPLTRQYENYKKYVSGEMTKEVLGNQNEIAVAIQTNNLLADPVSARLAAMSKVFPNSDVVTTLASNKQVMNYLKSGSNLDTKPADPFPDEPEDQKSVKIYFQHLDNSMKSLNAGTAIDPEGTAVEVNNNLTNVLRGISAYGNNVTNPSDFNSVVEFLSRPDIGKFIVKQGGLPDKVAAHNAGQVMQFEYEQAVLPLIKAEIDKAMVGGSGGRNKGREFSVDNQASMADLVEAKFIGGGVSFVPKGGGTNQFTMGRIKELNEKVTPVLNRLIRMTAHLGGTVDYKAVYESQYAEMFSNEPAKDQE